MIRPEECPYRSPSGVVWDTATFRETLEGACARADYVGLRAEQARARAAGRTWDRRRLLRRADRRRLGHPGLAGLDHRHGHRGRDPARGSRRDGHRDLRARVPWPGPRDEPGPGRGRRSSASTLADVRVVHGDTAASPSGTGTYASRSAVLGGGAAILAGRALREKIVAIAAHQLEASAEDIEIDRWAARRQGRGRPHRDLARRGPGGIRRHATPSQGHGAWTGDHTLLRSLLRNGVERHASRRGRGGSVHVRGEPAHSCPRRGLRAHHQPAHRGGTGRRRCRPGRRSGPPRGIGLRIRRGNS